MSATDKRKYDDPPGLQDNGEIVFNYLAGDRLRGGQPPRHVSRLHVLGGFEAPAQQVAELCEVGGGIFMAGIELGRSMTAGGEADYCCNGNGLVVALK